MEGEENWEYTETSGWVFREGEEVSEDSGSPERAQNSQGTAVLQGETAGAAEPPTGGADSVHPSREDQSALSDGGERNDARDRNCGNARGAQQVVSGAAADSRAPAPGGVDPSAEVAEAVDEAGVLSPATSKVQHLVVAPAGIQRQHCWCCLIEALWALGIVASYPHQQVWASLYHAVRVCWDGVPRFALRRKTLTVLGCVQEGARKEKGPPDDVECP